MDYGQSDSSGTDDDLPPSHQNRIARGAGRISGNGRSSAGPPYARMQNEMERQIHWLEQEAYSSVLRAFKAQSDAITWAKEGLMSELRKELRVSDEEHRELLGRVNADDLLKRIREWRQGGANQGGLMSTAAPDHDPTPSPSVSASRKKQKTAHILPSLPMPSQSTLHPLSVGAPSQPSSSAAKRGTPVGAKNKKPKTNQTMAVVSPPVKPQQFQPAAPVAGRVQIANRGPPGPSGLSEPPEAATVDPLIGRKVRTRWPEDNNFYEAVITDYNPQQGLHALVYDINTTRETWEWVNLKEITPGDIMWDWEGPAGSGRGSRSAVGRGIKKSSGRGGLVSTTGRGRGISKGQPRKDFAPSQNGIGKKVPGDIEILHTDTLLKEVERIFGGPQPDPADMEKAKKLLKEHEQSLVDAIARLAEASDGESEDGRHPLPSHTHSIDRERGWRNMQYNGNQHTADDEDDTAGDGRAEGSDGEPMIGEGGVASDDQQDGDDGDEDI